MVLEITIFIFLLIMLKLIHNILEKKKINFFNKNIYKKKQNLKEKKTKFKNDNNYTNIYELAPYQVSSLSTIDTNKRNNLINQIKNYPYKVLTNPKWSCPWTNNSNNLLCFIDKHLNRKCIWTC